MRRLFGPALILLVVVAGAMPAESQEQIFVQFEETGWEGDSTDPAHVDWVEVIALDHGISRGVILQGGIPQITSQSNFENFSLLKAIDKLSPLLQSRLTPLGGDVVVEVCRPTVPQECYLRIELRDVQITDVTAVESTCLDPAACEPDHVESFSMLFERIRWIYTFFDGKGGQQTFETCWDVLGGSC